MCASYNGGDKMSKLRPRWSNKSESLLNCYYLSASEASASLSNVFPTRNPLCLMYSGSLITCQYCGSRSCRRFRENPDSGESNGKEHGHVRGITGINANFMVLTLRPEPQIHSTNACNEYVLWRGL